MSNKILNKLKNTGFLAVIIFLFLGLGFFNLNLVSAEGEGEGEETQDEQQNIVELAQATEDLSTLVTAVETAELVDTLSDGDANFTVFAPTNAAFDALPDGTLDNLLDNPDELASVLTYHVVDSEAFAGDLSDGQTLTTVNGATLTVNLSDDEVRINDALVTTADVDASNGVVHIIDSVLLPPEDDSDTHSPADTGIVSNSTTNAVIIFSLVGVVGVFMVLYTNKSRIKSNFKE